MSRPMRPFRVFGFASVHDAMAAESALKAAGIVAVAIPSPKELGNLCGIALRLSPEDAASAAGALADAGAAPTQQVDILDM